MVMTVGVNARIGWVDAAKGFAILSIISGHFCAFFMNDLEFAKAVFLITGTFHVPLFFLLSGYTMNADKWMGAAGMKKLAKRCFLPYVFAGVISVVICLMVVDGHSLYDFVFGFFYGAGAYRDHILFGDTSQVNAIGLIWFLPALFVGKVLASAMSGQAMAQRLALCAAMFLVGAVSAPVLFLPFDIQQGMCAAWFITVGIALRKSKSFEAAGQQPMVLVGAGLGCLYVCAALCGRMSIPMYCNSTYHTPFVDMICCSCVCVAAILFVKFVCERIYVAERALTWCGLYSIAIFVFHALTLAPGDSVKWWIYGLVADGVEPVSAFVVLLTVNLIIVIGATIASKHIGFLRYILYGGRVPVMPETMCRTKSNACAMQRMGHVSANN